MERHPVPTELQEVDQADIPVLVELEAQAATQVAPAGLVD